MKEAQKRDRREREGGVEEKGRDSERCGRESGVKEKKGERCKSDRVCTRVLG